MADTSRYDRWMAGMPKRYDQDHWLDTSDLDAASQFKPYFHGPRIRVDGPAGRRFGRVGKTTGWKPAFLLMHRRTDSGSWDVLGPDDKITAVKIGSHYKELT